jgi:hypothetical protein
MKRGQFTGSASAGRGVRGLYLIDTRTGFETAIAALPFGFSSGLELMN